MEGLHIREIYSAQVKTYKEFLREGLVTDEAHFRISPDDDRNEGFPTRDVNDSFTLGAFISDELAGVVSFERDGRHREKLRHKGILFRMYVAAKFRKKGLSLHLIEALISRVKAIPDIEQINLTVISANDTARHIYTRLGFERFAQEKNAIKWKGIYFDEEQYVLMLNGRKWEPDRSK